MTIQFEKVSLQHQTTIFDWLAEPHVQEFWDNSPEHKQDIIHFIKGRPGPSSYFNGVFTYWVGSFDGTPYCFILTSEVHAAQNDLTELHKAHLSTTGKTITLDFAIGNKAYLGKKLAAPTLEAFITFYRTQIDPKADTFFIDPDDHNPKARHVYEKAGFKLVGNFESEKAYWDFAGNTTDLMVKQAAAHD